MSETNPSGKTWHNRLLYSSAAADDRSRMRAVANNLILHLHPTKVPAPALRWRYTWGMGGISATLAVVLIVTGVLLMFRYDASVAGAYTSIQWIETQVMFGSLIRALHHWSANLLVVTLFLHLLRVFYTAGFKDGRAINWTIGIILFLVVLAFNFTGYLLPWDQRAFWATTVGTDIAGSLPAVGDLALVFLRVGWSVSEATLGRFYGLHVIVTPLLTVGFMLAHFIMIRRVGVARPL